MAIKELTAKVKLDIRDAESKLTRLETLIKSINKAVTGHANTNQLETKLMKAAVQAEKVKQAVAKTQLAETKVATEINKSNTAKNKALIAEEQLAQAKLKTASAERKIAEATEKSNANTNKLLQTVKGLASAYLGMKVVNTAITASDTVTKSQNKLNLINGGDETKTSESMDKIYTAAQRSRSGYGDMLTGVSKSMMVAGEAFQGNIDNAIRFEEIMAKSYKIAGASAAEQSNSMYQLRQALGSGRLQGDELRSVMEQAPMMYKEIEKFAQKIYGVSDSLKDMASDGMISSDMVVAAVMSAGDEIDKKFKQTKITFEDVWTQIKNTAMKAFEPAMESLNKMINSEAFKTMLQMLNDTLLILGNTISWVFDLFARNIDWLLPMIVFACVTIAIYLGYLAMQSVKAAMASFWAWIVANSGLVLTLLIIFLVIWAFYSLATGATTVGKVILSILAIIGIAMAVILFPKFIAWLSYLFFAAKYYLYVGAQALAAGIKAAIGWMMANWVLLLIIIAIAAVVLAVIWLSDSFSDACGMIVGGIMTAVAFVWNLIVGVINGIIQYLWTYFVEPWIGIIEWVLNVFNGGFNSFGDAVKNLLGNIISWFLSLGKVVTKIIDAIFGTNWTDGLNSLQDKVLSWGKNEKAITLSREAPSLKDIGVDRWSYSDAYNTGYKWGESAGNWITDKVSNIGNMLKGKGLPGIDDPAYVVDGAYDPSGMMDSLGNIEDDTGKISDSMNIENDDLEYLRKLAEMEWRNEFTTAEIKVNMTNNNTVNEDMDLDGMVSYLSEVLREEMTNVAYGVHY